MNHQPLVIIGAPRSGTNMLRDALTRLPGAATWPCDELNLLWRHGNNGHPTDELPEELARPAVQRAIRRRFHRLARRYGAGVVVEKTCANALRVPFVQRVLPEARYIHIHRDGLDAVASALERWQAPLDIPYLLRKARFVPPGALPVHAGRFLVRRLARVAGRKGATGPWGPRFEGMDRALVERSLDEVCALQWQHCVDLAADAFAAMPEPEVLEVAYADFVREPEDQLRRICTFAGIEADGPQLRAAVAEVQPTSIGKGRSRLSAEAIHRLEAIVGATLARYGYRA